MTKLLSSFNLNQNRKWNVDHKKLQYKINIFHSLEIDIYLEYIVDKQMRTSITSIRNNKLKVAYIKYNLVDIKTQLKI